MQSKVKISGHAVHPMIVPFPIAFNTATLACCITYAINGNTFWFRVGFIANCVAAITTVVAVLPGLIDWFSIPAATDAKSTGLKHMAANVVSLGLFIANAAVMYTELHKKQPPPISHVMMTGAGFLIMLYAGFKGWTLVQSHHIGIDMSEDKQISQQESVQKNASEIFTGGNGKE